MNIKNDHSKNSVTTIIENRRTGKVARLPKEIREIVNQLIEDGCTYLYIIKRLEELGHPGFFNSNISRWRTGGYQTWLREKEARSLLRQESRELHLHRQPLTHTEVAAIIATVDRLFGQSVSN